MGETCHFKLEETAQLCGKPATKRTSVNEDPWGAGFWCDAHAPAAAAPIEPPDPNKDNRQAPPPAKA